MSCLSELCKKGSKRKIKNENICIQLDSNQKPFQSQAGTLDRSVSLINDELCLKVVYNHGM